MCSPLKISFLIVLSIFISFVICNEEKLLSRKRRYLTFPEESTLQLVYDQIIGVVDYTNLFILGITCALAWQLPHEPFDEEMLKEQFLNGSDNEPKRRIDEDVTAIDYADRNYNSLDINSWNDLFHKNNVSYSTSWDDNTRKKFSYGSNNGKPAKKHLVYAAIGKRSLPTTNKLDRFYLNHHRTTRHTLYRKIEKFLTARGAHGSECLRKALCETKNKNKQTDEKPTSLVGEIMRVIFSLPAPNEDTIYLNLNERDYDVASQDNVNCTEIYSKCKDSLWTSDFV
ncbi:hypothetical protein Bhyg_13999 [Pseudolycoriella hygida]|uniref:Uncharacterized protein n=1 Tax=Pseudolycoriella hygida TaxID=35572 RepID=A0A9Q0MR31_9DIPT|nr:hypothetical protein Bhyg_13999 [Pseudolycoriella hygida]